VLTIFIFFVFKNLLNCYFFASRPIDSKVDDSKRTLARYSLDFIFSCQYFGLLILGGRNIDFRGFIGLCLHVFVKAQGFVLINFEILALRICILGDVFRININEFWF
jgi:hypothetical protein